MSGKSPLFFPKIPAVIAIFLSLFLNSGCSIWDSTTAFFNTFYNAQRIYAEAEAEVWAPPEVQKQGKNNYLAQFNVQPATKTKFSSVIEKCSKLLQYHPNSNLVDDAVMMIGMSYYYQGEWQQADRKFKELVATYPDGGLAPKARMLSAAAAYRTHSLDTAVVLANKVLESAKEDNDDALIGHAEMILAMVDLDRDNRPGAAEHLAVAAKNGENASLRTARYLALGDLYAKLAEYDKARSAYKEAADASENYLGEYRGFLGVARMRAFQEDYNGAQRELERLRENFNNREFFGEIELEKGNVFRQEGELKDAIEQYLYVDTAYSRTEFAATACFQMGLLYEGVLVNYDSARAVYIRGKAHSGVATTLGELIRRIDYLTRYDMYTREIRNLDSVKAAAIAAQSKPQTVDSSALKKDSTAAPPAPKPPPISVDSLSNRQALMMSELATLLYATMGHPDSASRWYRALIAEYPDSPPIPRAMFTLAQIVREDSTSHPGSADSLYNKIIERFPHTEYANEARRLLGKPLERLAKDSAEVAYTKAEDLFLGGETTQAIEAFQTVTAQFPKSSYAPRAQYAVGWTYENVAIQPDSAITHYQALVSTYPTSPYVALVQPKLAEVQQQKAREAQAVADSGKALQAPPPVPVKAAETVQPKRATEERASPASREPGAGRRSRRQQQPVQVE